MVAAPIWQSQVVSCDFTRTPLTGTPLIKITTILLVLPILVSIARRIPYKERTLILGTSPLARLLIAEIAARPTGYTWLAGVVDDVGRKVERPLDELLVGPLARLATIVEELRPDRIVIALADRRGRLPVDELLRARVQGIAIEDGVQFYERLTGKIAIEALMPHDLISSPDFRKSHVDLAFGHALSLLVSLAVLVVLLPLFALIALAIKLDSPGPVFFVQNRVGLRGTPMRLLKFRTMHPVDRSASEWVRDNCDRITRVGQWLRRYRLDELPQLVNVLRGEMNLVGPRPHPVSNVELFKQHIPYYWLRSVVRPGLTGWAQVRQGYANGLEEETEKMRHDLYYIKHMSAWLDLRILFSTVQTVLAGHGCSEAADRVSIPAVRALRLTPAPRRTATPV
jgi:exopolysaccharide biosynthesis polyprenyl glycosylphosphotransferase